MPNASKPLRVEVERQYANPPVHEVILDVQFHTSLDEKTLRGIRGLLEARFDEVIQTNLVQLEVGVGPMGPIQNTVRNFGGWQFKKKDGWILQAGPGQFTLHHVRPGQQWPSGEYVGWRVIYPFYMELLSAVRSAYGSFGVKRAGLRYLNRLAIPLGEDVSDWLAFKVEAPKVLHELYAFNLRHTWARAGEDNDISAMVGLAKIEVPDSVVSASNYGVLLDIDIFNLWMELAPTYGLLPDWFDRAHSTENEIFEGCLTDAMRARFGNR